MKWFASFVISDKDGSFFSPKEYRFVSKITTVHPFTFIKEFRTKFKDQDVTLMGFHVVTDEEAVLWS